MGAQAYTLRCRHLGVFNSFVPGPGFIWVKLLGGMLYCSTLIRPEKVNVAKHVEDNVRLELSIMQKHCPVVYMFINYCLRFLIFV